MTTSAWSDIADRIVNRIQTVANVGNAFNRLRLAFSQDDFYAFAKATVGGEGKARVWMVTLAPSTSARSDASGRVQWNRMGVIEGFLQIEDAASSEHTAVSLAEAIMRALDTDVWDNRLNNLVLWGDPCRLVSNEPRFFGFVACHYVRIELPLHTLEDV